MQPWQNEELEEIRRVHLEFAQRELEGDFAAREKAGEFSRERWKKCADFGVLGICMKRELGGQGRPVSHAVAALEGLGYGCRDSGFVYAMVSQLFGVQMPLQHLMSPELAERYLPKLIRGELLAAHCFTEETAGSDAYSMETRAQREGEHFFLTGTKRYITNVLDADVALVFARTGEGRSPFALSAFMVELDWKGVSKGREFDKLGLRTVRMGEVRFEGVDVPAGNVVGGVGRGLRVITETTGWERAVLFTAALGQMQRIVDDCVARSRERKQFGKPIGAYQQVSSKIADMIMRHRLSRMVVYDMAARLDRNPSTEPLLQDTAIAKLFVSEAYQQLSLDALQIFGVRGYLSDSPVQQAVRDSLSAGIYAGTSETMRNLIAKIAGVPVQ